MTVPKNVLVEVVEKLKDLGVIKSQSELCKALDMSPTYLSEMMKGKKPISIKLIRKMEDVYNISLAPDIYKQSLALLENDMKSKRLIRKENANIVTEVGMVEERLMRLEGYVTVLFDTAVASLSHSTGKQPALIRAELQEALAMVLKHSLDEFRKQNV